ncbi:exopolyphosphatase [Longibacter salinarum]|uniref:Exopolyphosphatase n=1 Tax=Longibacter salinarum TaxID=1850348 RepID=A0A2A8CY12_9BACT|nr:exopolyphosphatase [Longibacter salinarum]PEN13602.1 exopolyphosphatase [Longibacter salinarum]
MRIAAIDVGTNTAQLLIADVTGKRIERLHVAERFVRLGEGVDATGRISKAALRRLGDVLRDHRSVAEAHEVDQFVVCATSASRDATNRDEVIRFVRDETGLPYEILSGEEEATWSFAAATAPFRDVHAGCLVVDVGGGSTELVAGTNPSGHTPNAERSISARVSLNIGCIRLTERCFTSQPPAPNDISFARNAIDSALEHATLIASSRNDGALTVIGTAGTASALALVDTGPDSTIDPLNGSPHTLTSERVRHWREDVLRRSPEEVLALHPKAMEHRATVFPVGVMILDAVLEQTGASVLHVSPYELRHGLILRHLASA